MRHRDPSGFLGADHWPASDASGLHSMEILPASGPVHEIVAYLDALPQHNLVGSVPDVLRDAATSLQQLDATQPLRDPAVESSTMGKAISALQDLFELLTAEAQDRGLEIPEIASTLTDPQSLRDDLQRAIEAVLISQLTHTYDRVATYSLILFDEDTHNGKLIESFRTDRAEWERALRPPRRGEPDLHLAIVPPPSATTGIHYLAADLGCEDKLPCVVFLGSRPEFAEGLRIRGLRWSCRSLEQNEISYPEQLRAIYKSAYSGGIITPGTATRSLVDKTGQFLADALDIRAALRLLAGAVGGAQMVGIIDILG